MQYHNRSRLPPPPFGRGGGARTHNQPRPPLPSPPPQRRYEVLMEAGRLAAEYLVEKGVLPPSSLQRSVGAWAAPPAPPPPQQQALYGRMRYDDNTTTWPRHNSSTSRDDYISGGSYNGRGKRKYGNYRRGHSDRAREREKERGRSSSNEDGAPGFRRERRGSDEARSCVTEGLTEKAVPVREMEMEDNRSNAERSSGDVTNGADGENEEGEMKEDEVLSSESQVVEQGMDSNGDVNNASTSVVMEPEATLPPDGTVTGEKAQDNDQNSREASLDLSAMDDEAADLENGDRRNLLLYCDIVKAPTRPRSVRAQRHTAYVQREVATVHLVSCAQTSVNEAANETSLTKIQSVNRQDHICQENSGSSTDGNGVMEPMLLQENKTSLVSEDIREERNDAQLHLVQESNEETDVSPLTASQKNSLMQETDLSPPTDPCKDDLMHETDQSPLKDSRKDCLIQENDLSPLTDSHKDSTLFQETNLSPLITSHEGSLMHESDLSRTMSSHEDDLNLHFKEGTQICNIDMLPQGVDLLDLSDQGKIIGDQLFPNVGAEALIKMEEGNLDQSSSVKICDLDSVGGAKVAAIHNNPGLGQCSAVGSSLEPEKQQQEDFRATAGNNVSTADDLCRLPLDSKDAEVIDIGGDIPIEVAGFGSSKAENEMICSSMDSMMHPGVHTDDLPGIQDGYSLAISDYLGTDIPCFPSMQPDFQSSICANSEGIPVMDDPIYGSLTDIGFMDVWGQSSQDYDKFF